MKNKFLYFFKWLIFLSVAFLSAGLIYGLGTQQTGHQTTTSLQSINYYDPCASVRHTGSISYFVPTKTLSEWTDFKNNKPSDVEVSGGGLTLNSQYWTDGFVPGEYGYTPNTSSFGASLSCSEYSGYSIYNIAQNAPGNPNSYSFFFALTNDTDIPNTNSTFSEITIFDSSGTNTLIQRTRSSANSFTCQGNFAQGHSPGARLCVWRFDGYSQIYLQDEGVYQVSIQ